MADKPRLKETDEIFSAIRVGKPKAPPAPAISGRDIRDEPETPATPPVDTTPDQTIAAEPVKKKTVKRRRPRQSASGQPHEQPVTAEPEQTTPVPSPEQADADEAEDRNPLDFGKYTLPEQAKKSPKQSDRRTRKKSAPKPEPQPTPEAPVSTDPAPAPPHAFAPIEPRPGADGEQVFTDQGPKLIQPYQFEDLSAQPKAEAPAPREVPGSRRRKQRNAQPPTPAAIELEPQAEPEPNPKPEPVLEEVAESNSPARSDTEKSADPREQFIQELSERFDEAFTQRFEGKKEPEADLRSTRRRRRPSDLGFTPKERPAPRAEQQTEPVQVPPQSEAPDEDVDVDAEADSFLAQFTQQVREEEEQRADEFKDTLAQKFERERQRYLRELGIPAEEEEEPEEDEEKPGFTPPQHRRLDLRIQPEMHGAVTYSRSGEVRPLDEDDEEDDEAMLSALEAEGMAQMQTQLAARRGEEDKEPKTPEELLLELAAQNSLRRVTQHRAKERALQKQLQQKEKQQTGQFTFLPAAMEEEPEKPNGFFRRSRVVAISAVAALLVLSLVGFSLVRYLGGDNGVVGEGPSGIGETAEGTLDVWETRNFEERGEYDNVRVHKANISLSNMSVTNYLVIEEIASAGTVYLENVTVGEAIYLNASAVDALSLNNVSAGRLVIANPQANVALDISGAGLIQTLEVRTPTVVTGTMSLGSESMGVRDMLLRRGEGTGALSVKLNGVELVTLSSQGETVLELSSNSFVEDMSVVGSLALSGGGRVLSLSAGPDDEGHMTLSLQDANIARLALKGNVALNLNGRVDSLVAADDFTVGGGGRVDILTVNARSDGGRILADLSGVEVQSLVANTELRVNAAGNARVYELTANNSVYALGNKVNHLIVNNDGVIYEIQPDKTTVAYGVRPPESMADNPNLDYNLSSADNERPLVAEDDGVATVCGHTRENGGFTAGDGSRQNPFEVSTPAQLAHVGNHLDSHFVQTADIDISDDTRFITGFEMIAANGAPFSGSYDGGGYEIRNLRISSTGDYVGLFAENIGTIQYVTIASGEVRSASDSRSYVGGVVGLNYQGGVVEACSNGARVIGNNDSSYVGGISGYNFGGRVRNCYNAARISNSANVGGVVGVNRDDAVVSGSYSVGIIEGDREAGAVVGTNSGGTVTNCYYLVETSAEGIGSGGGTATAKTSAEFEGSQMVADLSAGSEATPWTAGSGSFVYPMLRKPEGASVVTQSDAQDSSGEETGNSETVED